MSSDVNFSLANALVDFGAARRIDPKGLESIQNTQSDKAAKTPRFDHLVSNHEQASRVATQARARHEAPEPQHASRPADRRPQASSADVHRAERPEAAPVRAEKDSAAAHRKEEAPVAKADETKAPANEATKAGDEAEQPTAADTDTTEANDGKTETADAAAMAQATPATIPVADPKAADATLSTDGTTVIDPALAASTDTAIDATALLAQTGAVPGSATPGATSTSAADVPLTSVPTVGSAPTGVAAPELEAALLAATVAKAGEAGKAEVQSGLAQSTSKTETTEGTETASTVAAAESGGDAKAQLAALLEGEQKASGTEAGKGDKGAAVEGASEKGEAAKAANTGLHPTRAAPFAEMLDGFMGPSSIHRPADILAGLDRSVAAQAMNRTSDIARPTPLQMLPIEIGMQAVRGVTSFQIRLDPAELGRVDVKLHIQDNGEVKANLIVDRVDTLNMLRRDASTLQNAFEQAGLKQTPDGLTFSLRGEGQQGQQQEQGRQGGRNASDISDDLALQAQIGEAAMRRVLIPNSSIDRMV